MASGAEDSAGSIFFGSGCHNEAPILEGIPVAQGSGKQKHIEAPPPPPPTEVSREAFEPEAAEEEEELLPLTQPRPRDDVHSLLIPLEDTSSSEEEPASR